MRAIAVNEYGAMPALMEVPDPQAGPGQVLIKVEAAGINPFDRMIADGALQPIGPAQFPLVLGVDLAGIVEAVGEGAGRFAPGEELFGVLLIAPWGSAGTYAERVAVSEDQPLARVPQGLDPIVAAALPTAGSTALEIVESLEPLSGKTAVLVGAAGGVGTIAVQLAKNAGAAVIGLASEQHHQWLSSHGVIPVTYGEGVADRIRSAAGAAVDAFLDTHGGGYVELALELGVRPERIDTIADFQAGKKYGVKTDANAAGASAEVLGELAGLVDRGLLEIPIANVYPLDKVQDAYRELEQGHTLGKIVLRP